MKKSYDISDLVLQNHDSRKKDCVVQTNCPSRSSRPVTLPQSLDPFLSWAILACHLDVGKCQVYFKFLVKYSRICWGSAVPCAEASDDPFPQRG